MKKNKIYSIFLLVLIVCLLFTCCTLPQTNNEFETNSPVSTIETTQTSTETEPSDKTSEPHIHSYVSATCTEPEKCSSCGETRGNAKGHEWQDATCSSPQKCISCNATTGNKLSHNYTNGTCSNCGQQDASYDNSNSSTVWIPKTGSKYHNNPNCSNMKNPSQVTKSQAINRGYEPCKKCY